MDGISMLKDPGTGKDVQMRIGCHSGAVVAGIVGLKMPRSAGCMALGENFSLETFSYLASKDPWVEMHFCDSYQTRIGW